MSDDTSKGPMLRTDDLVLEIGRNRILDKVNVEVRRGETLCVLGPSGAGKSMLLRAIVRLTPIKSGDVLLDGLSFDGMDPAELRRRVSLVQQQAPMLEGTVEDNLRFGPEMAGAPPVEIGGRIREALRDALLDEGFLFRKAEKLSGGERQRVAMARAISMMPEVLLLDEPTAGLDPRTRRAVEDTILRLQRDRGLTMVIVTHDVDQSCRLGDTTVLLRRGRVIAVGDSKRLMDELEPDERDAYLGELERWEREHEEVTEDG
jgi:ABC-type proline/glycine betaine transport system ATPase subunit